METNQTSIDDHPTNKLKELVQLATMITQINCEEKEQILVNQNVANTVDQNLINNGDEMQSEHPSTIESTNGENITTGNTNSTTDSLHNDQVIVHLNESVGDQDNNSNDTTNQS